MKYLKFIPLVIVIVFVGTFFYYLFDRKGYIGYGDIHQRYIEAGSYPTLSTFCWKDDEIVYSWHDPIDSVIAHPELPKQRREQGKALLKSLQ